MFFEKDAVVFERDAVVFSWDAMVFGMDAVVLLPFPFAIYKCLLSLQSSSLK